MAIRGPRSRKGNKQRGITLVEVIISVVVMTVGIVGLLAAFAASISVLQQSRQDSIARQEAQQFMEGIYAARNTSSITFANLQNVSEDPINGFFQDGMQSANLPGPDGLMNTKDDLPTLETGPDGKPLTLKRQIQFSPLYLLDAQGNVTNQINPDLRKIVITIQYGFGNLQRTYTETTYISTYH
jgi:type II secretory pathway pseudopilin PulG